MTTINNLPPLTQLTAGAQFVLWSPNNGDSRRLAYSVVKADILASVVLESATEPATFANKTLNLSDNFLVGTLGQFNDACTDADFQPTAYTQAATGAVLRTVAGKLNDVVSVKDFGAVGNGVANDTAALQAALDSGRALFFPAGTYNLTAKLVSAGKGVQLHTDAGVTLKWLASAASQGIECSFSNITNHMFQIGDIGLITEKEGGGTAIKGTWPSGPTGYNRLAEFGKIQIAGADIPGQVGYWDAGIDLTNGWIAFSETVDFYGKGSGTTPLSTAAVIVRGTTTDAKFNIRARFAKAGLLIAGFSELVDMSGSIFVACDYAVDCSGTAGLNTPGLLWFGGHASTFKGGIRSINILQANISGILFYKRPDSAENYIGIDLDFASTDWQLSDCKVFSLGNPGGGTCTAIRDAGVNNISTGMRAVGCDTDVNIVANASGFSHEISRNDNQRGQIVQGDTDGQVIVTPGGATGSTASYFDTLAVNSATPSILGYRRWAGSTGHFLTANTNPTSITDFTGAFPGDEFVLQANDVNTTLVHSAGLLLNGAVNKVLSSGEHVRLRRITSTAWKQVG